MTRMMHLTLLSLGLFIGGISRLLLKVAVSLGALKQAPTYCNLVCLRCFVVVKLEPLASARPCEQETVWQSEVESHHTQGDLMSFKF